MLKIILGAYGTAVLIAIGCCVLEYRKGRDVKK